MSNLQMRLANLLCVKSLVTLTLTGVFAWLSVIGAVPQEFMSIYTMVVGFYFGTQTVRKETLPTSGHIAADRYETDIRGNSTYDATDTN